MEEVENIEREPQNPFLFGPVPREQQCTITVYPLVWQDSTSQSLTNRLKEITNEVSQVMLGSTPAEVITQLSKIVERKAQQKVYFQDFVFTREQQQMVDCFNVGATWPWLYDHLVSAPFRGAQYASREGETFLDMDDTLQMWAYTAMQPFSR